MPSIQTVFLRKGFTLIAILFLPFLAMGKGPDFKSLLDFPVHLESGIGYDVSNFRDFATSPLIYRGSLGVLPLGLIIEDERKEFKISMRNSLGAYDINFGDETSSTIGYVNNIRFTGLYRLKGWSSENWNFKAGFVIDLTTTFRLNSSLQNNATGYELFGTLSGAFKVKRDLSRKQEKVYKPLGLTVKLKQRKRSIAYKLDVGIINSTVRNGYAYMGQEFLLNNLVLFDNYKYSPFSGFRMGSQFDYSYYLLNGNGIRLSYIWDAWFTGGDLPSFEMAHHIMQFSLLYKLK